VDSTAQYGQGCETGKAGWIAVQAPTARADAALGATGYHFPAGLALDPVYADKAHPAAVRFCWANTQNGAAFAHGEVLCAIDSVPGQAPAFERSVSVTRFLQGDGDFNSFTHLAFQPGSGILYVAEAAANGDIFACLTDGADRDLETDGCVRAVSLKESGAVPGSFAFTADGKSLLFSIKGSNDAFMPLVEGSATDDVLLLTGFEVPAR
jgi:hypothetical protein